jgi:hypothetical protein
VAYFTARRVRKAVRGNPLAATPTGRPGRPDSVSHRKARARVEHDFTRMKTWKLLRDCRLKGDGVHHAMLGIARLYNPNLAS